MPFVFSQVGLPGRMVGEGTLHRGYVPPFRGRYLKVQVGIPCDILICRSGAFPFGSLSCLSVSVRDANCKIGLVANGFPSATGIQGIRATHFSRSQWTHFLHLFSWWLSLFTSGGPKTSPELVPPFCFCMFWGSLCFPLPGKKDMFLLGS